MRLRLAVVGLTHPFRGGISHYTTLLCRALARRHEVRLFALYRQYPALLFPGRTQTDRSAATLRTEHEATIDSINPWTWWTTARRIVRYRPELIVFSWWHPFFAPSFGAIARLSRRLGSLPSCFLCHNALPHEATALDRLLLRFAFNSPDAFIAHSLKDRDDLRSLRPGAVVHHSPHPSYAVFAADQIPPAAEAKARLGLSGKRVLLFFGFVREYKGLRYLLEAVASLPAEDGFHLLLVGEFYGDVEPYRPLLDRLRGRGQVTLVDRYVPNEEVPLYFSASDLLMVPYTSATQSGVIQIGYAFSKPVVATSVGGIPEVVEEGRTGYLVPPRDSAALAAAVRTHFDSPRRQDFERHIAALNEKYSWDRMVETIEGVCTQLREAARGRCSS